MILSSLDVVPVAEFAGGGAGAVRGVSHLPRRHQDHAAALLQRLQDIQKLLRQVREGNSTVVIFNSSPTRD